MRRAESLPLPAIAVGIAVLLRATAMAGPVPDVEQKGLARLRQVAGELRRRADGLARITVAQPVPWSSDRYPDRHSLPPAFPWLGRRKQPASPDAQQPS